MLVTESELSSSASDLQFAYYTLTTGNIDKV